MLGGSQISPPTTTEYIHYLPRGLRIILSQSVPATWICPIATGLPIWLYVTPNYALSIGLNIQHIAVNILQLSLNRIIRILEMEDHRLPKTWLLRLAELLNSPNKPETHNWIKQLRDLLSLINEDKMLDSIYSELWKQRKENILSKFRRYLASANRERYLRSSGCQVIYPVPSFEAVPKLFARIPQHLSKPKSRLDSPVNTLGVSLSTTKP